MSDNGKDSSILRDRPSRPRASERQTRAPMVLWDRIRFLVLLAMLWMGGVAAVWSTTVEPLQGPLVDAIRIAVSDYWWLLALMAVEFVRQVHYFIEEHSKGYYRFWQVSVFGSVQRRFGSLNDYTRFRVARAFKYFVFLLAVSTLLGNFLGTEPPWLGIVEAPASLVAAAPLLLRLVFYLSIIILQFGALFWFLSRGGVDTIMPDEIETRFDDVKGQDAALGQLKETLVFLEDPEAIESRGGYVPGGVLLWGPPGTGKTLMAQAIAGETGRPFVAVEPSAFINMFMGVGPLKVKGLYRKLRRLAMRYGGVIVFFDEADSLGSRGQQISTGGTTASPWVSTPGCNGVAYLSSSGRDAAFHYGFDQPATGAVYKERVIMGNMGGGGGMGTLQMLLAEMSGLTKPKGLVNRFRKLLGMKPKPPPEVPHPAHLRDEHAERARPGDVAPGARRPSVQGRLPAEGRPEVDVRVLPREGATRPHVRRCRQARDHHAVLLGRLDQGHRERGARDRDPRRSRHGDVFRRREGQAVEAARSSRRARVHRARATLGGRARGMPRRGRLSTAQARRDRYGHDRTTRRRRRVRVVDPPEDQFVQWRSEREIDVMTALASLAGERMFFDGDHSMGVGGDMRAATGMTSQALAYYAMGDRLASRSVTLAPLGAMSMETGGDRGLFDSTFGQSIEDKLSSLYDKTLELLEQNRVEVLTLGHALETAKTITGDDVQAIIEGTIGPTVDGRPYHDPSFVGMLERYHDAVLRAHKQHAGVDARIPVPVPPPPVEVAIGGPGNGQEERPRLTVDPHSPPRPDGA